ncbi:hypothetical protein EVAR_102743_1 [Eumeta japonica]|uniref:Uncharacterized protein n=1 Tax=Eumeta variegata TaxID=151549 RepID=A0A4C1TJ03_EUMVA|nr:hypothetical protein EVAR_102743_1 [Eumeta japonica]
MWGLRVTSSAISPALLRSHGLIGRRRSNEERNRRYRIVECCRPIPCGCSDVHIIVIASDVRSCSACRRAVRTRHACVGDVTSCSARSRHSGRSRPSTPGRDKRQIVSISINVHAMGKAKKNCSKHLSAILKSLEFVEIETICRLSPPAGSDAAHGVSVRGPGLGERYTLRRPAEALPAFAHTDADPRPSLFPDRRT